ncbi:MAG: Uma2 family endonuclease [Gemmataceae bacterium]|nr:Uma2 family endonuclease [Gemmataceae bacterium]MCI0739730.1 Uma2 family endonuclease [Gemmataceae bacterium]
MRTKTLITAEEFAKTGPETDGFELVRGELVPIPPPRRRHGEVCINAGFLLKQYVKRRGKDSVVGNDAGILTERDPDTVRGIDVMLYLNPKWKRKGAKRESETYDDYPPELAVEVRSPKQSWKKLIEKVNEYLSMGVKMVWVIDPSVERVTVFTPDSEPVVYAAENELDGGEVLPGFRCKVAEFFE